MFDNEGNPVAFGERRVLAPQYILDFLSSIRARKDRCIYERIRKFLEGLETVPLHEDTSKWNITGIIACLRWDRSHNLHNREPWCYCRLEKYLSPPPYHEICLTNSPNLGVVRRFRYWLLGGNSKEGKRVGYKAEMTKSRRFKER